MPIEPLYPLQFADDSRLFGYHHPYVRITTHTYGCWPPELALYRLDDCIGLCTFVRDWFSWYFVLFGL